MVVIARNRVTALAPPLTRARRAPSLAGPLGLRQIGLLTLSKRHRYSRTTRTEQSAWRITLSALVPSR